MGKERIEARKKLQNTIRYLKTKKKILFLTTSNRWAGNGDSPKSTRLAYKIKKEINGLFHKKITIMDVSRMKIYPCEGNVSSSEGNICGVKNALLKDTYKNPSGCHRCWASIHNEDDELWKISKELIKSDCVIFFGSVRWGQTNGIYQKLIERLTWLENRQSTLKEDNILKDIEAGIIFTGQNWNGKKVIETQKIVLDSFGFKIKNELCWNWQYTKNSYDETPESYKEAVNTFRETFIKK